MLFVLGFEKEILKFLNFVKEEDDLVLFTLCFNLSHCFAISFESI